MKLLKRLSVLVGVAALAVSLTGVPAHGNEPPPPPPTEESDSAADGRDGMYYNCHVSAGPNYLGVACPGSKSEGQTVAEILCNNPEKLKGCLPVPDCWDDRKLTPEELADNNLANVEGPEGHTYWWRYCLKGVDPKTYEIEPGGMSYEVESYRLPNADEPEILRPKQKILVAGHENNGGVPAPFAAVSPTFNALVYRPLAFFNSKSQEVTVPAGNVQLRAVNTLTSVRPLGEGRADEVNCPGAGINVEVGDTEASRPNACWFTYERSSAQEQDMVYHVEMTSHWEVYVSFAGGGEELWTEFDKSAITRIPVREVQAIVIY